MLRYVIQHTWPFLKCFSPQNDIKASLQPELSRAIRKQPLQTLRKRSTINNQSTGLKCSQKGSMAMHSINFSYFSNNTISCESLLITMLYFFQSEIPWDFCWDFTLCYREAPRKFALVQIRPFAVALYLSHKCCDLHQYRRNLACYQCDDFIFATQLLGSSRSCYSTVPWTVPHDMVWVLPLPQFMQMETRTKNAIQICQCLIEWQRYFSKRAPTFKKKHNNHCRSQNINIVRKPWLKPELTWIRINV